MSTVDSISTINGSYKKVGTSGKIGFNGTVLASYKNGTLTYTGSIFPLCGPLLFVIYKNNRHTVPLLISFKYKQAIPSGYTQQNILSNKVYERSFTEAVAWSNGSITIDQSKQIYYEKLYKTSYEDNITRDIDFYGRYIFKHNSFTVDYIYHLSDITYSHEDAEWDILCLSSNGARIANGYSFTSLREFGDGTIHAFFSAPRICPLCEGKKFYPAVENGYEIDEYECMIPKYSGTVCRECDGFGYTGFNASDNMLYNKGIDVGVTSSSANTDEMLQKLIWAKHWWFYPTVDAIKNFISFFTRINKSDITVYQYGITDKTIEYTGNFEYTSEFNDYPELNYYYAKEPHIEVFIPLGELVNTGIDIDFISNILKGKLPIGYAAKVAAYNVFTSAWTLGDNAFYYLDSEYVEDEVPPNSFLPDGVLHKTSMIYNARGSMYSWATHLRGVFNTTDWDGTSLDTLFGTPNGKIGNMYPYGPTLTSLMKKGTTPFTKNKNLGADYDEIFFNEITIDRYKDIVYYDNFWAEDDLGTVQFVR